MMPKLFVLLENIRSVYNVGSVFRTSDSAGVDTLFLTGYTAFPPHKKLDKTALGSIETVKWEHRNSAVELVKILKEKGVKVISLESFPDARTIYQEEFTEDLCLVFGNEETGVSEEILSLSDEILQIPMFGVKDSLNIAVSAGIAIYEFKRKELLG